MNRKIKLSHFDTLSVAKRFLVENTHYEDFQLVDCRFTDEIYHLNYRAKDLFDRDTKIAVMVDLLHRTIEKPVVIKKDELELYL